MISATYAPDWVNLEDQRQVTFVPLGSDGSRDERLAVTSQPAFRLAQVSKDLESVLGNSIVHARNSTEWWLVKSFLGGEVPEADTHIREGSEVWKVLAAFDNGQFCRCVCSKAELTGTAQLPDILNMTRPQLMERYCFDWQIISSSSNDPAEAYVGWGFSDPNQTWADFIQERFYTPASNATNGMQVWGVAPRGIAIFQPYGSRQTANGSFHYVADMYPAVRDGYAGIGDGVGFDPLPQLHTDFVEAWTDFTTGEVDGTKHWAIFYMGQLDTAELKALAASDRSAYLARMHDSISQIREVPRAMVHFDSATDFDEDSAENQFLEEARAYIRVGIEPRPLASKPHLHKHDVLAIKSSFHRSNPEIFDDASASASNDQLTGDHYWLLNNGSQDLATYAEFDSALLDPNRFDPTHGSYTPKTSTNYLVVMLGTLYENEEV